MSKQTRRGFLQKSAIASASVAVVGHSRFVHASPQDQQTTSPNSKLHVAIVGVNGRGGEHINGMLENSDVQITHICDVDEGVGQKTLRGDREIAERKETSLRTRHPQTARRQIDRHDHCRNSEPLARARWGVGHASR